jgi:hypothetical protein
MKHAICMVIGCTLPLLLIFLAPALGLGSNFSFLIFMVAMFACHLLMPMHHGEHNHEHHQNPTTFRKENYARH